LKPGETRYANLFLEFPDAPVTFRLTQGSGPVHIHGQHLVGEFEGELDELDEEAYDEEDSDNEIRADDDDEPKAKKMKKDLKKEKNNKKK
jgi:nucleophosmin 3